MSCRQSLRDGLLFLCAILIAQVSAASLVTWTVDSDQSYVRWTVPDQTVSISGSPVPIRIRDLNSTTVWTDAGGRRAVVEGELLANFVPGSSIQFLAGQHALAGVDDKQLRPNPAAFSGLAYTNTSSAPAAFGGRLRSPLIGGDIAFFSFRDTEFDIGSGVLTLDGGGAFAAGQTSFGASQSTLALDVINEMFSPLGPDDLRSIAPLIAGNLAGGMITDLGGGNFRLDYEIDTPIAIVLGAGVPLATTLTGVIIAYAFVPEPSTAVLVGVATAFLAIRQRRSGEQA